MARVPLFQCERGERKGDKWEWKEDKRKEKDGSGSFHRQSRVHPTSLATSDGQGNASTSSCRLTTSDEAEVPPKARLSTCSSTNAFAT